MSPGPTAGPQPDFCLSPSAPHCPGGIAPLRGSIRLRVGTAALPEGGAGEPWEGGVGWHQDQDQRLRALSHDPRADALARRASAKQWAEAQLEAERFGKDRRGEELPKELLRRQDLIEAIRKARAELQAEAAADKARERDQQPGKPNERRTIPLPRPMPSPAGRQNDEPEPPANERSQRGHWRSRRQRRQVSGPRIPRLR